MSTFQAVDRDRSGSIDEEELQAALSSGYQKFSRKTIRLLMFLFGNPKNPSKIGMILLIFFKKILIKKIMSLVPFLILQRSGRFYFLYYTVVIRFLKVETQ